MNKNAGKKSLWYRLPVMTVIAILNGFAFTHGDFRFLIGVDFAVVIIILAQIRDCS